MTCEPRLSEKVSRVDSKYKIFTNCNNQNTVMQPLVKTKPKHITKSIIN